MAGEMDLHVMLSTLSVARRPGVYTVVSVANREVLLGDGVEALIGEAEGTTVVLTHEESLRRGLNGEFQAAWLTLEVHSSLDAVGLTAAVSTALAADGIPCNILAGFHHDHLLVPVEKADQALERLAALRSEHGGA